MTDENGNGVRITNRDIYNKVIEVETSLGTFKESANSRITRVEVVCGIGIVSFLGTLADRAFGLFN